MGWRSEHNIAELMPLPPLATVMNLPDPMANARASDYSGVDGVKRIIGAGAIRALMVETRHGIYLVGDKYIIPNKIVLHVRYR